MWYRIAIIEEPTKQLPMDFSWQEQEEQMYDWVEEYDRTSEDAMEAFLSNPQSPQNWPVFPFARLQKIWNDYMIYGSVRDEKGLQELADLMIRNTQLLHFNTVMSGHTQLAPEEYVEQYAPEGTEWTDELDEMHGDHITDQNGTWRLSDYALEPLMNDASQLRFARTPEEKLHIIDRMLDRVHARSDIAGLYIEGGSKNLDLLFRG